MENLVIWLGQCWNSLLTKHSFWDFPEQSCQIPLKEWLNPWLRDLVVQYGNALDSVNNQILFVLRKLESGLEWLPWWSVIVLIGLIAWSALHKIIPTLLMMFSLLIVAMFGLWDETMITLAIMFIAISLSVIIGVPLGLLMASNNIVQRALNPFLDAMQTMPPFVYLIPVVFFLGLGNVSAIFAICIYALPPIIRLTNLGIRLVNPEIVEAAEAFGASPNQILWGVKVPLALPTLMAGLNQTIMMAIAMVVIASMIGARGLGASVLRGLTNGNVGHGLEAGLAILVLAIIFDRVTAAFGKRLDQAQSNF